MFDSPMKSDDFVHFVQQTFDCSLRYIDACKSEVQQVAICGGAGAEFIDLAIEQGADIYITADVKYHELQAACGHIGIIDLDHWTSEHFTREIFEDLLMDKVKTYIADSDASPVKWLKQD